MCSLNTQENSVMQGDEKLKISSRWAFWGEQVQVMLFGVDLWLHSLSLLSGVILQRKLCTENSICCLSSVYLTAMLSQRTAIAKSWLPQLTGHWFLRTTACVCVIYVTTLTTYLVRPRKYVNKWKLSMLYARFVLGRNLHASKQKVAVT